MEFGQVLPLMLLFLLVFLLKNINKNSLQFAQCQKFPPQPIETEFIGGSLGCRVRRSTVAAKLTVKDLQLVELPAGLEVLDGEGDVVTRFHLDHPGARLEVGEAAAR